MQKDCPLCLHQSDFFAEVQSRIYYLCNNCKGIFLDSAFYMTPDKEEEHYRFHHNNPEDKGYQNFISPITSKILQDYTSDDLGLDFGSGTGSAVVKVLQDEGYQILEYDPYFHPVEQHLDNQYDYIACSEVVEHFHQPAQEFQLLKKLLKPQGKLYCMTHLYSSEIEFQNWYYKNDHTHVFMYQKETMEWICKTYGFSTVVIDNRLIVFF